ncbi:MAG: hypothetical protein JWR25_2017 [Noviherbaspirillum sp.]|nr:hypothetical protein [Noviherbaspirillum sp.]
MKSPERKLLAKDADKFIVRLPDGMRQKIMDAPQANNRSMNAEIVARLAGSFSAGPTLCPLDTRIDRLADAIAEMLSTKLMEK